MLTVDPSLDTVGAQPPGGIALHGFKRLLSLWADGRPTGGAKEGEDSGEESGAGSSGSGGSGSGRSRSGSSGSSTRRRSQNRGRRCRKDITNNMAATTFEAMDSECGIPSLPITEHDVDLQETATELGIEYFLVSYSTLNTDSRTTLVPRSAIGDVQRRGCGVPGAMFFECTGADPEMQIVPDPSTLVQLPWKPEIGWLSR